MSNFGRKSSKTTLQLKNEIKKKFPTCDVENSKFYDSLEEPFSRV